jgi:hypothetical protein
LFDHAELHVKKHPLTTLGISLGMGWGAVIVALLARNGYSSS